MDFFKRNQSTQRRPIRTARTERNVDNSDLQYKAKSKLIGAVVLALLGILILPFIFSNDEPINQAPAPAQAPLVSPSGQLTNGSEGNIAISAAPGVLAGEANTGEVSTGAVVTNPAETSATSSVEGAVDNTDLTASTQIPQSIASSVGENAMPPTSVVSESTTQTQPPSETDSTAGNQVANTSEKPSQAPVAKPTENKSSVAKHPQQAAKQTAKNTEREAKRNHTIKDENRTDDGSVALALLEGKTPSASKSFPKPVVKKGHYSVQVGSFSSVNEARAQRDKLSSAGVSNAFVQSAVVNGRQTYRLRVGPFTSQESAQAALTRLRGLGHSGFITGN